jgi:hypothetical protein
LESKEKGKGCEERRR